MKKLVLVMVCTLLLAVFVSLNYLLWDRENKVKDIETLESSYASSSAIIDTLGREIKKLEDEIKLLKESIQTLEDRNSQLQSEKSFLEEQKLKTAELLNNKTEILQKVAGLADFKPLEEPVRKYADAVNRQDYETAYNLLEKQMANQGRQISMEEFADICKSSVESMKISTMEFFTGNAPGHSSGSIVFRTVIEVKTAKGDGSANNEFKEGMNERYISVVFDDQKEEWVISAITTTP